MDQDPLRNPDISTAELHDAFVEFFEGHIYTETDLIRRAVHTMRRADVYFAKTAEKMENKFEQALGDNDEYGARLECLRSGVQAYVFSGVSHARNAVLTAVEMTQQTPGWIKKVAWPTDSLVIDYLGLKDKESQDRVRRLAYYSLRSLCSFTLTEKYFSWRNKP